MLSSLETPCGLVHLEVLRKNARDAAARCELYGAKLRVHFKTSKCVEVQRIASSSSRRASVSTLTEARFLADSALPSERWDVVYAALLGASEPKMRRFMALAPRFASWSVFVDSCESLRCMLRVGGDFRWRVWIIVDSGYGRAGVTVGSEPFVRLVELIRENEARVQCVGFYTHAGHAYAGEGVAAISAREALETSRALEYFPGVEVSIGSTPSFCTPSRRPEDYARVTELHPGNFAYFDMMQVHLGSCAQEDVAFSVLVSVVGVYEDHMLVDVGSLAMSKERLANTEHCWGSVADHPELRIASTSQELSVLVASEGHAFKALPLGTKLRLLPVHSCLCATSFPQVHAISSEGEVEHTWPVCPPGF